MGISTGIVGAAGFTGSELVRLLLDHPSFDVRVITSDSLSGIALSEVYPNFTGITDLRFSDHDNPELLECEAVFLAVPHTAALAVAPRLIEEGISVFDLSADYRLVDPQVYEAWYATPHTSPELLTQAYFGLPELFRDEFREARDRKAQGRPVLVACAGCYPTASSLAAYPALKSGRVKTPLIIDAISGVTGAGKKATERTHFCMANESVEAYAVGNHRHTPEIEQILGLSGEVVFTPHLAPFNRGILATVYMPLAQGAPGDLDAFVSLYREFYKDDCFVEILKAGDLPKTASVAGTNRAHIGLALQDSTKTLLVISAIDNLCKGSAGQAVQCANIVFGFSEDAGLRLVSYSV